jgi:hypothetical protein
MIIATALLLTSLSGPLPQGQNPATSAGGAEPQKAATSAHEKSDVSNPPTVTTPPRDASSPDGRRRIEFRFGGWDDGQDAGPRYWHHRQWTGYGAIGFEYLSFVRNDLGVGVGLTSLVRPDECRGCSGSDAAQSVTSIPLIVRWYPARRLVRARTVEPYVAAGIGPVFGVDIVRSVGGDGARVQDVEHPRTEARFGGRVGGGMDVRLGRAFTIGVGGAWNWDTGFSHDFWLGPRPKHGEFTMSFGWNFGK